jgi:RNA polymerase sigma factor (sigma-70 family)
MSPVGETRHSLINRVRDGRDQQSWQEFHDLYESFLRNIARRNGLSHDDADELVQEVFAKVFQAIGEFQLDRERGRFRGWLKTIALRKIIDRRRRRGREVPAVALAADPAAEDPLDAEWDRQYRQHVLEQAMVRVRQAVEPATWKCFEQHTLAGRPAAEVAAELGMKPNTVFQNAARTLKRVREKCEQYEESLTDGP